MNNEFITKILNNMQMPPKKYDTPFIVAMSGHCGSGKSHIAKILSKELKLYIVGGDSVRRKIRKEPTWLQEVTNIDALANEICYLEIEKLLKENVSIVVDKSTSSTKDLENLERYNVPVILINLISSHELNKKRITQRSNTEIIDIPSYGDIDSISGVVTEELYNQVLGRKIYNIPLDRFDYTIDARVSLKEELEEVEKIAKEIAQKYN
ncbi:MAG: AAA family ATPase [Clostridia bacterium]|nr:AAA family ATPase [Clostridia bacterium]